MRTSTSLGSRLSASSLVDSFGGNLLQCQMLRRLFSLHHTRVNRRRRLGTKQIYRAQNRDQILASISHEASHRGCQPLRSIYYPLVRLTFY